MDTIQPLTPEQLKKLPQNMAPVHRARRVMAKPSGAPRYRQSVNICTGRLIGGNVINQLVYWDRPAIFFAAVLDGLRQNNPDYEFTVI